MGTRSLPPLTFPPAVPGDDPAVYLSMTFTGILVSSTELDGPSGSANGGNHHSSANNSLSSIGRVQARLHSRNVLATPFIIISPVSFQHTTVDGNHCLLGYREEENTMARVAKAIDRPGEFG
jgi:hypothetical protein